MKSLRWSGRTGRTRARRVLVVAVAPIVLSATLAGVAVQAKTDHWAAGLPGCDPSRPAVAHHAGQVLLRNQPGGGPIPCGVTTGWPTAENRIEVTNSGTLIYQPAILEMVPDANADVGGLRGGFARSNNGGRTWLAEPVEAFQGSNSYPLFSSKDNNLYVDHETGRLFFYLYNPLGAPPGCGPGGATIAYTDNDGTTWSIGNDIDHSCSENPTVLTAEPRVSTPQGYENVVYLCGIGTSSGIGGAGQMGLSCSKSVNGGGKWLGTTLDGQGFYSGPGKDRSAPYSECAGASSSSSPNVQPQIDGTLLVVVSCGGKTFLAHSADEGATWSVHNEIPHGGTLRADSEGNLFLLRHEVTDGLSSLLLSHSTDGGATWSEEQNVVAPGVTSVGLWFFMQGTHAAGQVGHVAVAYFGKRSNNTTSDGFITETREALEPNAVFWSGQVNNPDRPLSYNTANENSPINFLHFIGGALSPDGQSAWGSFHQSCGPDFLEDPACQDRWPGTNPSTNTDGFAGRLAWPETPRSR